jgi:hypothetical protein
LNFQPKSLPTTVLKPLQRQSIQPPTRPAYPSCRTPHTNRNIKSLVGKPSRTRLGVRTPPTVGRNCGVPCIRWDADGFALLREPDAFFLMKLTNIFIIPTSSLMMNARL